MRITVNGCGPNPPLSDIRHRAVELSILHILTVALLAALFIGYTLHILTIIAFAAEEHQQFRIAERPAAQTQLVVVIHIARFLCYFLVEFAIVEVFIVLINELVFGEVDLEDLSFQLQKNLSDFGLNNSTVREVDQLDEAQPLVEAHELSNHNDCVPRGIVTSAAAPEVGHHDLLHHLLVAGDQQQRL